MNYTTSEHAHDTIKEREIKAEWIDETIENPTATEIDPDDATKAHALKAISENGNRVLRVIYNRTKKPPHVITVYFDRKMKDKL